MKGIDRVERYRDESFDTVIMKIKSGEIRTGKYSNMVKIRKGYKTNVNNGELFKKGATANK